MNIESQPFVDLYSRYYRLILTTAHQRLGSIDNAQDAAATVFRIAWERYLTGDEITLQWLYGTLRNVIGNQYRRQARSDALFAKLAPLCSEIAEPVPIDDQMVTRWALRQLPYDEREIIRMSFWEDLSASEIAAIIGCTPTAVRLRLLRARVHLRAILIRPTIQNEGIPLTEEVSSIAVSQFANQIRTSCQRQ